MIFQKMVKVKVKQGSDNFYLVWGIFGITQESEICFDEESW